MTKRHATPHDEAPTLQAGYTPPVTQRCGVCAAYSPLGECRWDPPVMVLANADPTMRYVWPKVGPDDWCMRWLKMP